jgi:hypothetical protein
MIIIIPLPLFFAQTVYGVGGLTGRRSPESEEFQQLMTRL